MKTKKVIAMFLMGLMVIGLWAEGLNSNALFIKRNDQRLYSKIKAIAIDDWGDDHGMILYVINNQANSYFVVSDLERDYPKIFISAATDWNRNINGRTCYDWGMIEYVMKNQIEAQSAY